MDELTSRHCRVPPDYYDQGIKNNILQGFWHKRRFKETWYFLDGLSPRQILDIGCHGGTFTEVVAQKFPTSLVFGLDVSVAAIDYGKKVRPGINFRVGTADNLPFPDGAFDLVTCFDTFEHLPDPKKALSEMRRVLTQDGQAVFLVPTESLLFKIIWFLWGRLGPGKVWEETHIQNFSGRRLDRLLKEASFVILAREKINWGMLLVIRAKKQK